MKKAIWLLLALLAQDVLAQESATLKRLAENGVIYLGHNEATLPFSYVLADRTTPAGFSWDLCGEVVKGLEAKLGRPLQVVPVVLTTANRFYMVKTQMADIECGASTHTLAREKLVSFSTTFFVSEVRLMVRADSGIKGFDGLAGKRVLTTTGTTADRLVKQTALQRNLSIKQVQGRSHAESMGLLERGEADAYVADDAVLAGRRAQSAQPEQWAILDESLSVEPYGLALPVGDPAFKAAVDETLAGLMKSGRMEALYNQWFTQPLPGSGRSLNLPASPINKSTWANPNDRAGQ